MGTTHHDGMSITNDLAVGGDFTLTGSAIINGGLTSEGDILAKQKIYIVDANTYLQNDGTYLKVVSDNDIAINGINADALDIDGSFLAQGFRATYDVSGGDDGSIGTHYIDVELPEGATIIEAYYKVLTTFTSNTDAATIALGVETDDADGLVTAIAISDASNPWDAGDPKACTPDPTDPTTWTVATTDDGRRIAVTVANEDLTAGKLVIVGRYIIF